MILDHTPDFYRQQDELARQYARRQQVDIDRAAHNQARAEAAQQDMFVDQQPSHTVGNP